MTTPLSSFLSRTWPGFASPALARIFSSFASSAGSDKGTSAAQAAPRHATESSGLRDMRIPPVRTHGTFCDKEPGTEKRPRAVQGARGPGVSGAEFDLAVEAVDQDQGDGSARPSVGRSLFDLPG